MAKRFTADYTAADVLSLWETRYNEGDEARIREMATLFRQLCRMEHAVEIPGEYKAITRDVRTPFVRDAHHRITSSLVAKRPTNHVTPKDDARKDYREAANIAERFDTEMIERLCKELGRDIDFDAAAALVRDGESVIKVVDRRQAWANFPARQSDEDADTYKYNADQYKRGADLPLAWRVVDRLTLLYEGGEYGDEWVCEFGEYARPFLRSKYQMVANGTTGELVNPKSTLEGRPYIEGLQPSSSGRSVKVEFFTSREWHVIIDGSEAPGFPKANPYSPYLPYFRAAAYDSESLLYSLMFLVPRLDELLTMKLNWSFLGAYPNPVLESVPNATTFPQLDGPFGNSGEASGSGGQKKLTWKPGMMLDLPLGKKMSFLIPPPVGKDINDLVVIFKSLIDVAGIPSIMRGMSGAGDSGYLANQLRAAAEMAYRIAAIAGQRQREKALEFSHWLIANVIKQTVYVHGWTAINSKTGKPTEKASKAWIGLSPDTQTKNIADISKLGPVSCNYRPTLPTDEQARAMIAMQLTNAQKPLFDRRHALENYLQEEDPDSILDAIWVEQALEEEPLRSQVIEQALREAGFSTPAPTEPAASPLAGLVGPNGEPLQGGGQTVPPGPSDLQPVPLANQAPPGMAGVPGLTTPITPTPPQGPQGIPGNVGGRAPGTYPGQPGGPNL